MAREPSVELLSTKMISRAQPGTCFATIASSAVRSVAASLKIGTITESVSGAGATADMLTFRKEGNLGKGKHKLAPSSASQIDVSATAGGSRVPNRSGSAGRFFWAANDPD